MMPALSPYPAPRKHLRLRPTPDLPPLRATRVLDHCFATHVPHSGAPSARCRACLGTRTWQQP